MPKGVQVQVLSPVPSLLYKIDDRPKKSDLSDFFAYSEPKKFYMKTVDDISPFQTQNKTRTGVFENSRDSKDLRADLERIF